MTTRIKYHKSGKNLTSNYLVNYEGKRFLVLIHSINSKTSQYMLSIVDDKGDLKESLECQTTTNAKKVARDLLINKYNVRLKEEIRPRN